MLKIIDRYIGKQVFSSTLIAVVVLTLVLVLGNLFKEIFELLVDKNLPLDSVLKFVAYILPFSLIFTIPWGFLTAVLLVFGRMSADNEMISMRVAGLSMSRICRPVFILAFALAGLSLWINTRVAPRAQGEMKRALVKMVKNDPLALFEADKVVADFSPNIVYAKRKNGEILEGLEIIQLDPKGREVAQYMRADEAEMAYNAATENIELTMKGHRAITPVMIPDPDYPDDPKKAHPEMNQAQHVDLMHLNLSLEGLNQSANEEKVSTVPTPALSEKLHGDNHFDAKRRCEIRTEIHKRYSFSMACITFALIAIPLGVTAQRRETSIGFALSLVIAIIYFLFIIIADTYSDTPGAFPYLLMWIPNVFFIGLGSILFWRLSRK
jgi:lipopolysaccharide export LptBFGC system permease protein LptF